MSDPENLTQVEQSSLDLKIRKYNVALALMNAIIIYGFFFISMWCLFSPQCVQFELVSKHIGHGGGRDGNAIEKRRWANKI